MAAFTGTPSSGPSYIRQTVEPIQSETQRLQAPLYMTNFRTYTHTSTEGAGTGAVNLGNMPVAGKIRIFPGLSGVKSTQFAASADLHLGFRAYVEADGDAVNEDDNAFLDNADAGGAALAQHFTLGVPWVDIDSVEPITIFAMIDAGNIEADDTIEAVIAWCPLGS